jgi:hypothetical protein
LGKGFNSCLVGYQGHTLNSPDVAEGEVSTGTRLLGYALRGHVDERELVNAPYRPPRILHGIAGALVIGIAVGFPLLCPIKVDP